MAHICRIAIAIMIVKKEGEIEMEIEITIKKSEKTDIKKLWNSKDETVWEDALAWAHHQTEVKMSNTEIGKKLSRMKTDDFRKMDGQDFYRFLVGDYANWKYTDGKIRSRVQYGIQEFYQTHTDYEVKRVLNGIFEIEPEDIYLHIANITRINGIGVEGASDILSLILPQYFGMVDRFAVENLQKVYDEDSFYGKKLKQIDPQNIAAYDAVTVIRIYREKAEEVNKIYRRVVTPREIDMVLRYADEL